MRSNKYFYKGDEETFGLELVEYKVFSRLTRVGGTSSIPGTAYANAKRCGKSSVFKIK